MVTKNGFITVKTSDGLARQEFDRKLPDKELAQMLFNICHHQVLKTRYVINGWEIDVFEGTLKGIILAEKEMDSVDEVVEIPEFIEESIEVTIA